MDRRNETRRQAQEAVEETGALREGSNAGEVDLGVGGNDLTTPAGEGEHVNPDTDTTGAYREPNAGRDLRTAEIGRGQPTGDESPEQAR